MKIARVIIRNFRSIENVGFSPEAFNVMVGQNNHGKTNIIKALEWFYSGKGDVDDMRSTFSPGANEITKEEFERAMPVVFDALQQVWERSFNDKHSVVMS